MLTGFRFRREIDVLPWLKINISKTGLSATIGPEAAHVTVGSHGTYVYVDVPGKGTYFRRKLDPMMEDIRGTDDEDKEKDSKENEQAKQDENTIDFGILDRLVADSTETAFVQSIQDLNQSKHPSTVYASAKKAIAHPDGAFVAGFIAAQSNDWTSAVDHFERALANHAQLGELFAKYEIELQVMLPISEEFATAIQPNYRDCLLAIAVAHERLEHNKIAINYLKEIFEKYDSDDLVVRILMAELLDETYGEYPRIQHEIIKIAQGVQNESPLHATLMYYRGRALRRLNVIQGARDTLTKALRRKKGYPSDLLASLRYERALIYEIEGKKKRAHEEFEKIYALAPDLEDVAERIGIPAAVKAPPPPQTLPNVDKTPQGKKLTMKKQNKKDDDS